MPNAPRSSCAVGLCLFLLSAPAHAQIGLSLNRAGSGARAAGMGDAFIAVSDDGTAASWNPAGLAQLRQPEFSLVYVISRHGVGVSGLRSPDETVAFSSPRYGYSNNSIDFASAAVPFSVAHKPVTVQAGWHRLYQLGTDLTGNFDRVPLRPPGPSTTVSRENTLLGDFDVYSLAGAVKLTSRLAVGGSVDFWRGGWTERVSLVEESARDGSPAFFALTSSARLRGTTRSAGILLTYPSWNVGLVYHAPFWSSFRTEGQVLASGTPQRIDARDLRVRLPRSMGLGIARRFGSRWVASLALTHDQWTDALVNEGPGGEGPVNFFDGLPPEVSPTRDTVSLNAGLEHLFLGEGSVVPLRLGFGWEPQGRTDPFTRDPVDYLLVSVGSGYNTNRFKFDAALQYRRGTFRLSEVSSVEAALSGAPDAFGLATTTEWRLKVSAIYRLADTDALERAIRRIFG